MRPHSLVCGWRSGGADYGYCGVYQMAKSSAASTSTVEDTSTSTVAPEDTNTNTPEDTNVTDTAKESTIVDDSKPKQGNTNFPSSAAWRAKLATWCDTHTLPADKADGDPKRPSIGYAIMYLTADDIGYTLTDADRVSGRAEVSEDERIFNSIAKKVAKRQALTPEEKAAWLRLSAV